VPKIRNFFNAYLSADNRVTLLDVIPADTVSLTGLMDVVRRVRALVARDVRGLAGAEILVAGFAPSNVDTSSAHETISKTVGLVLASRRSCCSSHSAPCSFRSKRSS